MTARAFVARAILLGYPAEFRAQFGEEVLDHLESDPRNAAAQLFYLLRGAIAMHVDTFGRDIGYAMRRLRAAPLFAAIVVLTFALGIGANVAVFSVFNSLVLRPLPFAHTASLVVVEERGFHGIVFPAVSAPDAADLALQTHSIAELATERSVDDPTMFVDGKPFALHEVDVSPNYLTMLGVTPELGRGLSAADARPGVRNIIISDEIWRKYFGADPDMIGRTIALDGQANQVIGILPPHQLLPLPSGETIQTEDILRALQPSTVARDRGDRNLGAVAVLPPGVHVQRANAELALISERLARAYPLYHKGSSFLAVGLRDLVLRPVLASLWIVLAAVVGILLITCANVGNMLAARWSSRDRELAIRRALGASNGRIMSGLLAETGILALAGALVGVALAFFTLQLLNTILARLLRDAVPIGLDVSSLLYALAIVVVVTLLAGLTPMLTLGAGDLQLVLKSAGRGGDTSRRHYVRGALVIVEVALAIALVTISGLMLRNLIDLIDTPLGIRTAGIVTTDRITLPIGERENPAAQIAAQQEVLQHLAGVPGVDVAALALGYPESGSDWVASVPVFGRAYARGDPEATVNSVSPAYFRLFGERIAHGRTFTSDDGAGAAPVAVINEIFAARYLRGRDPLGARIGVPTGPGTTRWTTIVGVVSNERSSVIAENAFGSSPVSAEFFVPLVQYPEPFFRIIVHARRGDLAAIGSEVQRTLAQALPAVPPPQTFTIAERIQNDTVQARFTTTLLASLGFIALVLALSGIFGVTSYSVTHRVHEFGVRITLGATAGAIIADVLLRALATTSIGVAAGVIVAACAARAIVAQLGAISPFDPMTFATVVVLVFLTAIIASLQPALRASRVEPAESLRYE
jgi:putative ABC transport system permease protein